MMTVSKVQRTCGGRARLGHRDVLAQNIFLGDRQTQITMRGIVEIFSTPPDPFIAIGNGVV